MNFSSWGFCQWIHTLICSEPTTSPIHAKHTIKHTTGFEKYCTVISFHRDSLKIKSSCAPKLSWWSTMWHSLLASVLVHRDGKGLLGIVSLLAQRRLQWKNGIGNVSLVDNRGSPPGFHYHPHVSKWILGESYRVAYCYSMLFVASVQVRRDAFLGWNLIAFESILAFFFSWKHAVHIVHSVISASLKHKKQ